MNSFAKVKAITKREFSAYFNSALAYVFLCSFLIIGALFNFKFADWFVANEASLRAFFNFHPYLYLFFIPALGMRVWAEEDKEGTLELLLTMPISAWHAVVGKFFAGWFFIGFSLLLTFPMIVTVVYFGEPDWGRLISGYIGSFLVGGMSFALTSLTSAFTRNQVISYLFGFAVLLILTIIGMPQFGISDFLKGWLPEALIETLLFFSIQPHFAGLERGVFDLRDLIYFCSFIIYGLISSITILRFRKAAHKNNTLFSGAGVIMFSIILLLVNFLSRHASIRSDWTADKLYTLTDSTKRVMSGFDGPVTIRFYYSMSDKNQPVNKKAFALRVEDLLKEYAALSKDHVQLKSIDPAPGSIQEKGAALDGVEPILNKDGSKSYFGISISYRDSVKTIPVLSQDQADKLEYHLTNLFRHLQRPQMPTIGIMTDFPIVEQQANPMAGNYQERPAWRILDELRQDYIIRQVGDHFVEWGYDPKTGKNLLDAVVIYQFKQLSEGARFALDQYLMRGGKVILLADSMPLIGSSADKSFRFQKSRLPVTSNTLGVTEAWKVSYKSGMIVIDSENATKTAKGPNERILTLEGDDINSSFTALKDVEKVILPYSGYFQYQESAGISVTPLISASSKSKLLPVTLFRDSKVIETLKVTGKQIPLALHIKGKLPSFYRGKPLKTNGVLKEPKAESQVFLIGDMDWLKDDYTFTQVKKLQGSEVVRISDNIELFLNMVDTLVNDGKMVDVRMRREAKRELETLKDIRVEFRKDYDAEIKELQAEYKNLDMTIKALHRKQENQIALKDKERQVLSESEERLKDVNQQLNDISQILSLAEGKFQNRIVVMNAFAIPFMIFISWIAITIYRKRRLKA